MDEKHLLLSRVDIGRLFGVSKFTVDKWRREDPDFPKPVINRHAMIRWRESDIIAYMDGVIENEGG